MKYALIAAHYLPHLGGIERFVYNLAVELQSRGDEVLVIASQAGGLSSYEILDEIEVVRFNCHSLMSGRYPIIKDGTATENCYNTLDEFKPDLIIINARFYPSSVTFAKYAYEKSVPCICLEHGSGPLTVNKALPDAIIAWVEKRLTKKLRRYCNDFYGTCMECSKWLKHYGIVSKGELYNSVNYEEAMNFQHSIEYRQNFGIPKDAIVVTFTGRLLKLKGILQLIDAIEKFNDTEGQKIYLFVAGSGDIENEVKRHSSNYVICLGQINHDEVYKLLWESDIYCLPSESEAFCGGVLEAIACKCYVITTANSGINQLIVSPEMGTLLDTNDVDSIYIALKKCVIDKKKREVAVEKTLSSLKENFSWENTADKLEKIVLEMKK